MTELKLNLGNISDDDVTLLQEEGSKGMPDFAASCCDDCNECCGSCDETLEQASTDSSFTL